MKPSLINFAVSTTVLLSWLSLHDDIHAAASAATAEDSMQRSQRNLRATGEFLPADLEGLFTPDAHTDTTPLWVQDGISPDNISEFLDNRDLMDDTELIFHDIKPYDTDFPIGQCYVSLDKTEQMLNVTGKCPVTRPFDPFSESCKDRILTNTSGSS